MSCSATGSFQHSPNGIDRTITRDNLKDEALLQLSKWDRGIAVTSPKLKEMTVYIWFYEWNMFDAMQEGQNTRGTYKNEISVTEDQTSGAIVSAPFGFSLRVRAGVESVDMTLSVTNQSDHDWPELASLIPCFNPGPKSKRNPEFANQKTFFLGPEGLYPLTAREIHYNSALRRELDLQAYTWIESLDPRSKRGDRFVWSARWPDSEDNARGGLIVRESSDGKWVTGIAWERFLSAQGHNPWECMHLSINIGPLDRGQSREIRIGNQPRT